MSQKGLQEMSYAISDTPVGLFAICAHADRTVTAQWIEQGSAANEAPALGHEDPTPATLALAGRVKEFFDGRDVEFSDVPTPMGSAFFVRCWEACRDIPTGQTISYAELASRAGSPGAARAAGQAMRRNPLPVIVPCHRVVGSDGDLHGYAGQTSRDSDSLHRKQWLLDLERSMTDAAVGPCKKPERTAPIAAGVYC